MFNEIEVRIIGCLIEKEITTPDYYPLTLNSLTNACNQKSNRFPVVSYDEATVENWLVELRKKGIVQFLNTPGSRTVKYRHSFLEEFRLIPREAAILCELMLRGPETIGEIRAHARRMHHFGGPEEVEETLKGLMERDNPLITRLQRQSGKKEERYMHLLSGMPQYPDKAQDASAENPGEGGLTNDERIDKLAKEVSYLKTELESLRNLLEVFRNHTHDT
jgi:uncharacterized protein YceH (UPF0502 family)